MTETAQAVPIGEGLAEETAALAVEQETPEIATPEVEAPTTEEISETPAEAKVEAEKPQEELVPRSESNKAWVKARKAEQRAKDLERENEQLRNATPVERKPLTLEGHDFDEEALNQARIDEAVEAKFAEQDASRKAEAEKSKQVKTVDTFIQRQAEYREKTPGYDADNEAAKGIEFNPTVVEAIFVSEVGPAIQHALIKDIANAERINALPPIEAAREIFRMENELMTEPTTPEKKTTNAPDPIETVTTGGGAGNPSEDPDEAGISMEEVERRIEKKWNRKHQG